MVGGSWICRTLHETPDVEIDTTILVVVHRGSSLRPWCLDSCMSFSRTRSPGFGRGPLPAFFALFFSFPLGPSLSSFQLERWSSPRKICSSTASQSIPNTSTESIPSDSRNRSRTGAVLISVGYRVLPQQDLGRSEIVYPYTPCVYVYGRVPDIWPPPTGAPRRHEAEADASHDHLYVALDRADRRWV